MNITWYGHSCFKVETQSGTAVLDPYGRDKLPGLKLPPLTADIVLCSHDHSDHNAAEEVRLTGEKPGFKIRRIRCWHDAEHGTVRGENTIHIIEADGYRVAHMGDLGHMLSESQINDLGRLDAMMIPVGGWYTISPAAAKKLADAVGAQVTIPMHYRGKDFGLSTISMVSDFTKLCGDVEYAESNSIELDSDGARKTVILKLVN